MAIIGVIGMIPADPVCLFNADCGDLGGPYDTFGIYVVLLAVAVGLLILGTLVLVGVVRLPAPEAKPKRRVQREERATTPASQEHTPPPTTASIGWYDDGDFVRWWNGSSWTDDYRPESRGPLLRFLTPGGPVRSPMEWIWISILSFVVAVLFFLTGIAAVFETFKSAIDDESTLETATSTGTAQALLLLAGAFGILSSVSLLAGIIGLGVRSGVSAAWRTRPPNRE